MSSNTTSIFPGILMERTLSVCPSIAHLPAILSSFSLLHTDATVIRLHIPYICHLSVFPVGHAEMVHSSKTALLELSVLVFSDVAIYFPLSNHNIFKRNICITSTESNCEVSQKIFCRKPSERVQNVLLINLAGRAEVQIRLFEILL